MDELFSDGANFRAYRMQLGATLLDVAFALDVNVKSVKHWERNVNEIPDDAWLLLDAWEVEQQYVYSRLIDQAEETDGVVELPLYTNQKQYERHGGMRQAMRSYNRFNAAMFLAAGDIEGRGRAVGYYYPGEDD